MSLVASIALAGTEFVLGRVLADTDVRIELIELVPIGDSPVPYFWAIGAHDSETFQSAVNDRDPTVTLTSLDEGGDRSLYRLDWERIEDGFFGALADNDVLVGEGVRTESKWLFECYAPDKKALSGFRDDCEAHGIAFEVRKVYSDLAGDDPPYGLTEKQRETLELAFERGYFETPRKVTISDLAAATDISQQAASGRLQRAQRAVIAHIFPLAR